MNSCAPVAGGLLAAQEERADLRMIAGELRLLQHRIQQVVFHAGLPRQLGRIVAESAGWASSPKSDKSTKTKGTQRKSEKPMGSVTCQTPSDDFSASHHFHIQVVEKKNMQHML